MGVVVTTSTYTSEARVFAGQHPWRLDLKDVSDVRAWLRAAKLS